jgi:hypothetical protein
MYPPHNNHEIDQCIHHTTIMRLTNVSTTQQS